MTDAPLPWHATHWARLTEARDGGRLAHAWLLSGPAGVGKRRFARRLAASLLCESPGVAREACGVCRGCVQLQAGTHPNLSWLTREFNEKTDKEKRDISMDQLRAVMDRLGLSSHYGGARVVVVDPADALNTNGVNAILKTVEEPPAGLHILLVSERPMALAATLRSRCQRLSFAPPEPEQGMAWLRAAAPQAKNLATTLDEAGGAPLAALAALESGQADRDRSWREALCALAEHRSDPLNAAAGVDRDAAADWLRTCLKTLGGMLRVHASLPADALCARLARRYGAGQIEALLAECIEAQHRLRGNANPQLLIESSMISWWRRAAPSDSLRPERP